MSIVAPVSASYPVLTMLLSLLTGERLTLLRVLGMTLTIVGVVLVASGEKMTGDSNLIDPKYPATEENVRRRLGALFFRWIWSDVLAAGNTACADARRDSFGVDHSIDRCCCDDCNHFGGTEFASATSETRHAVDPGNWRARYQRLCLQQFWNEARADFGGQCAGLALWRSDCCTGRAHPERKSFQAAVAGDYLHFRWNHFDQPLSGRRDRKTTATLHTE